MCTASGQLCNYRSPQRRGPSAGWSQRCLERALECESALVNLLALPGVREELSKAERSDEERYLSMPTRDTGTLLSQWRSHPLSSFKAILSWHTEVSSTSKPSLPAAPTEDDQSTSVDLGSSNSQPSLSQPADRRSEQILWKRTNDEGRVPRSDDRDDEDFW